jgi:hypothetical protein
MPKIGNTKETYEMPCDRCGSKRKIAKTWTEKIKSDNGTVMTLKHTNVICTNKECQEKFEAIIVADNEKREKLKLQKELTGKKAPAKVV